MSDANKPDKLRIIFAGTPDFAATALEALLAYERCEIVAVYSQPDRPVGRGRKLQASPVKSVALQHDIPVCQPLNFKNQEDIDHLASWQADFMIVAAYGLLLPKAVLETPLYGCLNIHASLLPRWRGAAPIERGIEAGDAEGGITIMQMDEGLDTGAMRLKHCYAFAENETGSAAREALAELGGKAITDALDAWFDDKLPMEAQNDADSCYAPKINKDELFIDFELDAEVLARKIRAFGEHIRLYCELDGERLKLGNAQAESGSQSDTAAGTIVDNNDNTLGIACSNGILRLHALQLPGKKMLSVRDVLNSKRDLFAPGTRLQGRH